jgi:hypothetical protein
MAAGETGGAAVPMGMSGGHKLVCLAMTVLAIGAHWQVRV